MALHVVFKAVRRDPIVLHDNSMVLHRYFIALHGSSILMHGSVVWLHGCATALRENATLLHGHTMLPHDNSWELHGNTMVLHGYFLVLYRNFLVLQGHPAVFHGNSIMLHGNHQGPCCSPKGLQCRKSVLRHGTAGTDCGVFPCLASHPRLSATLAARSFQQVVSVFARMARIRMLHGAVGTRKATAPLNGP